MEYNEKLDVYIAEIEMPLSVKAFIKSINGQTIITVNANLDSKMKKRAVLHELKHMYNCDLGSEMAVAYIEDKQTACK